MRQLRISTAMLFGLTLSVSGTPVHANELMCVAPAGVKAGSKGGHSKEYLRSDGAVVPNQNQDVQVRFSFREDQGGKQNLAGMPRRRNFKMSMNANMLAVLSLVKWIVLLFVCFLLCLVVAVVLKVLKMKSLKDDESDVQCDVGRLVELQTAQYKTEARLLELQLAVIEAEGRTARWKMHEAKQLRIKAEIEAKSQISLREIARDEAVRLARIQVDRQAYTEAYGERIRAWKEVELARIYQEQVLEAQRQANYAAYWEREQKLRFQQAQRLQKSQELVQLAQIDAEKQKAPFEARAGHLAELVSALIVERAERLVAKRPMAEDWQEDDKVVTLRRPTNLKRSRHRGRPKTSSPTDIATPGLAPYPA